MQFACLGERGLLGATFDGDVRPEAEGGVVVGVVVGASTAG